MTRTKTSGVGLVAAAPCALAAGTSARSIRARPGLEAARGIVALAVPVHAASDDAAYGGVI
jgi:hypothetical protein